MKHLKKYKMFESLVELTPEQIEWLNQCTRGTTWQLNSRTGLVDVKKLGISWYNGPIAVDAIWKSDKDNHIYAKDNTDKVFKLDDSTLNKIASEAKKSSQTIAFTGTGTIKGVEGTYDATLTKVA